MHNRCCDVAFYVFCSHFIRSTNLITVLNTCKTVKKFYSFCVVILPACTCPIQTCPTPSSTQIAIMSKTPCPTAQTTTPPSTVTCPPKQTCQPCPRCTQAIQQTQTTLKCPPVTTPSPCPTIKNTKPAASSAAVSSISQTSLPYPGQNRDKQSSSESGMGNGNSSNFPLQNYKKWSMIVKHYNTYCLLIVFGV